MNANESAKAPIGHLAGIHALRGLAAMMVFLFHLHYVGKIPIPRSWSLIASHGGTGVELFFVISAFSLLHSNQKYVAEGNTQWAFNYLVKRLFRIAPLFYVMLIVHCLLILYVFNGNIDPQRIVLSILFLFNFAPKEAEGIVWASWSIGVEMVFYALLPLIMVAVRSLRSAFVLWFVTTFASFVYRRILEADPAIPPGYAHYAFVSQLGVFCGGVLGYWTFKHLTKVDQQRNKSLWWLAMALGPILALFLLSSGGSIVVGSGRADNQLWGLSFGYIAAIGAQSAKRWLSHPVLQYLGERSYSIYLTHAVVISFAAPLLTKLYHFSYSAIGGYGFAVCAAAAIFPVLLISEFTYRGIELRGMEIGKSLLKSHS